GGASGRGRADASRSRCLFLVVFRRLREDRPAVETFECVEFVLQLELLVGPLIRLARNAHGAGASRPGSEGCWNCAATPAPLIGRGARRRGASVPSPHGSAARAGSAPEAWRRRALAGSSA